MNRKKKPFSHECEPSHTPDNLLCSSLTASVKKPHSDKYFIPKHNHPVKFKVQSSVQQICLNAFLKVNQFHNKTTSDAIDTKMGLQHQI